MRIVNPTAVLGEDIATDFLRKKDYKILERNYRKSYGEIDIIAQTKNILVFIEVKTRTSNLFGSPLESITPWKLREVTRTAIYYKHIHQNLPDALRIDAIGVVLENGKTIEIKHLENISDF